MSLEKYERNFFEAQPEVPGPHENREYVPSRLYAQLLRKSDVCAQQQHVGVHGLDGSCGSMHPAGHAIGFGQYQVS